MKTKEDIYELCDDLIKAADATVGTDMAGTGGGQRRKAHDVSRDAKRAARKGDIDYSLRIIEMNGGVFDAFKVNTPFGREKQA